MKAKVMGVIVCWLVMVGQAGAGQILVTTLVDQLADDQWCSLREAVIVANSDVVGNTGCTGAVGGDDIILDIGAYTLTLNANNEDNAQSGDLDIKSSIRIIGKGQNSTIINAAAGDRIFDVHPAGFLQDDYSLTISDVTIQGANHNVDGGAVKSNNAILAIINAKIKSNNAGNGKGGGVYASGTPIIIENSIIENNNANTGDGIYLIGASSLDMKDSTVRGNTGQGISAGSGPISILDSNLSNNTQGLSIGALTSLTFARNTVDANTEDGIYIATANNWTIADSTISNNGRGVYQAQGTLHIENTTISGNDAGNENGGGIYSTGALSMTNSVFLNNQAQDGGGIFYSGGSLHLDNITMEGNGANTIGSRGGGAYVDMTQGSTAYVVNLQAQNNQAQSGGVFHLNNFSNIEIENSTFNNNQAGSSGGAINAWNAWGILRISSSYFSSNGATNYGGAIYTIGSYTEVSNTTFFDNSVNSYYGGALFLSGEDLVLNQTTFSNNQVLGQNGKGAAIYIRDNEDGLGAYSIYITDSTITNNLSAASYGGGIHVDENYPAAHIILTNSILANNTDDGTAPDCFSNLNVWTSGGGNIIGDASGCNFPASVSDMVGTTEAPIDPMLAPLGDYGGPTSTHTPLAGSPSLDWLLNCSEPTDQRGLPRPWLSEINPLPLCDSGAVEAQYNQPKVTITGVSSIGTGQSWDFFVNIDNNNDASGVTDTTVRITLPNEALATYQSVAVIAGNANCALIQNDTQLNCLFANLATDVTAQLKLGFVAQAAGTATLSAQARLGVPYFENIWNLMPVTSKNTSIINQTNLTVGAAAPVGPQPVSDPVDITFTLANNGPLNTAPAATFSIATTGSSTRLVRVTGTGCPVVTTQTSLTCNLGSLVTSANQQVVVTLQATNTSASSIGLSYNLTSDYPDADPGDTQGNVIVSLQPATIPGGDDQTPDPQPNDEEEEPAPDSPLVASAWLSAARYRLEGNIALHYQAGKQMVMAMILRAKGTESLNVTGLTMKLAGMTELAKQDEVPISLYQDLDNNQLFSAQKDQLLGHGRIKADGQLAVVAFDSPRVMAPSDELALLIVLDTSEIIMAEPLASLGGSALGFPWLLAMVGLGFSKRQRLVHRLLLVLAVLCMQTACGSGQKTQARYQYNLVGGVATGVVSQKPAEVRKFPTGTATIALRF